MIHTVSPLINTRVLKRHVDAVEECLDEAMAMLRITHDRKGFAERVALAAITATDSKPSFIAVVSEGGNQYFYGEFKSAKAAWKAIQKGCTGTRPNQARGYVAPLIPAPKLKDLGNVEHLENDRDWD